jgi:short-subunit dehydrogenase
VKRIEKTALVTGGLSGLGAALCAQLKTKGWYVVSIDRKPAIGGDNIVHIVCDLGDRAAFDRSVPAILAAGPYDLAIMNAGISATGRFAEIPPEAYLRLVRVNAEAPVALAATLLREKALTRKSALVFISSLSHFVGYPGAAAYAATKAAIAIYAKSIRKACADAGTSVTVAYPGPLRTDHAEKHAPPGADAASRMPPDKAAAIIIRAALSGRAEIVPGRRNRMSALAGQFFPQATARAMRRLIFDKLGEARW